MKQDKSVRKAGPYLVQSHSQGRGIVYFTIYPAFPEYNEPDFQWAETRYKRHGGGPGIFTSISIAESLEGFLNSVYEPGEVNEWHKRIKTILEDESKNTVMVECRHCGTVSCVPKEHICCPICGNRYIRDK